MRTILHIDADGFYASVECLYNPQIRRFPVAVIGDVENRHGIVLSKNQQAKLLGVKTGDVIYEAKYKAKNLVTVTADFPKYRRFAKYLHKIYYDYTNQLEPYGLDEVFLDITGSIHLFGNGVTVAEKIRNRIKEELGITVSIGVSWNKIFAKLGSDMNKPDGTTLITRDNYKELVWPLPVQDLYYVGSATRNKLNNKAIYTIGQLAAKDPMYLRKFLHKPGEIIHAFANGLDCTPVDIFGQQDPMETCGNAITCYRDLQNNDDARIVFDMLADSVSARLREAGLRGKGVAISVKNNKLFSFTRQCQLQRPTYISSELRETAMQLLKNNYDWRLPVRLVGLRAINLVSINSHVQYALFDLDGIEIEKKEKIEQVKDYIRRRFGHNKLFNASALQDTRLSMCNPKENHTIFPPGQCF